MVPKKRKQSPLLKENECIMWEIFCDLGNLKKFCKIEPTGEV